MSSKLGTLTLDLVARTSNFTQGIQQASSVTNREMAKIESSINGVNSTFKTLGATVAASLTVSQLKGYSDGYFEIVNKLKLVTSSQDELNVALTDTHKIAQATASEWSAVNDVYSKYMSNAKQLNLTQQEAARLTEITSKAVSISGSTTQAAAGALFQYGQTLDGNILRAQEYNSLVDGAGGLLNAMATGLNVTRGELRQMMLDGKLTGDVIVESLLKAGDSVDDLYGKTATTTSSSLNMLKTEMTRLVGEFDTAAGASSAFVGSVTLLSENLSTALGVSAVLGAYWVGTYVPAMALGVKTTVSDTVAKTTNALAAKKKAIADYEVAKSNLASTAAMARSMGATNAQTAAMVANARVAYQQAAAARVAATASMTLSSAMLGPVGLGLAVAGAAASFLLLKDSAAESTDSLMKNNETVDAAIKKYQDLSDVKKKSQLADEKKTLSELSEAYERNAQAIITNAYNMTRSNETTRAQAKELNALIAEFKSTKDLDLFSKKINNLGFINQESKDKFNKLAGAVSDSSKEYKEQSRLLDGINKISGLAVQGSKDRANAADKEKAAIEGVKGAYDKYKQSAFSDIKEMSAKAMLQKRGLSDNQVAERLKALKALDYKPELVNSDHGKALISLAKISGDLKDKEDARTEAIKEQNKQLEDQKKIREKQYSYTKSELDMLKRVAEISAKNDFDGIGARHGIPKNLLAAVMAQESKGVVNAKSATGAIGPFQTTGIYRKNYGLSVADSYDVKKSAEVAAKDIAASFKVFGNWSDAVTAYNAGVNGTKSLNKTGFTASAAKTKEAKAYAPLVDKWLVGLNGGESKTGGMFGGQTDALKDYQNFYEKLEEIYVKQLAAQATIRKNYASQDQLLSIENEEAILEIKKAFAEDDPSREKYIQLQNAAYQKDLENFKKAQQDKVLEYREALMQQTALLQNEVLDMQAKQSMGGQYGSWALKQQYGKDSDGLLSSYLNQVGSIEDDPEIKDAKIKSDLLLEAEEAYRQSKFALNEKYTLMESQLAENQHQAQMDIWQDLMSRSGAVFGQMAEMIKATAGESSAAYKTMFLVNQGISMAQAVINTEVAATKAMAEGGYVAGIPMSTAIRALGYASVGLIAGQTIAGMAHNGIDNIPKEGTWLLDGGERVLNPQQNKDLTNYLANSKGGGGDVQITQTIVFSDGSAKVDTQGQKELAQSLNNMMDAWARRNVKQGGALYNLIRS